MKYNGYRHQISNAQLDKQLAQLERTNGSRLACSIMGVQLDDPDRVRAIMQERRQLALWQIDNWAWVCDIEAQAADAADLLDTQEGARS